MQSKYKFEKFCVILSAKRRLHIVYFDQSCAPKQSHKENSTVFDTVLSYIKERIILNCLIGLNNRNFKSHYGFNLSRNQSITGKWIQWMTKDEFAFLRKSWHKIRNISEVIGLWISELHSSLWSMDRTKTYIPLLLGVLEQIFLVNYWNHSVSVSYVWLAVIFPYSSTVNTEIRCLCMNLCIVAPLRDQPRPGDQRSLPVPHVQPQRRHRWARQRGAGGQIQRWVKNTNQCCSAVQLPTSLCFHLFGTIIRI